MADRYWVGGTASWDATAGTKWATTSGGAGGASVPTTADNVFFNAASGAVTVTVSATANCDSLTCTGFTGTLAGSSQININGSLVFSSTMTVSHTGTLQLGGTTTGKIINFAGKTKPNGPINFNGAGSEWTLTNDITLSTPGVVPDSTQITLLAGTLNTNGYTLSFGRFSATGGTLTLGSSTLNCTSYNTIWSVAAGVTVNAGTSTLNISVLNWTNTSAFVGAGKTYYNVNIIGTLNQLFNITGANTFSTLSITAPSSTTYLKPVTFDSTQTIGTLTTSGTTGAYRVQFQSSVAGTQRTLSVATRGTLTNTNFKDIALTGAASPWTAPLGVWDFGNNSGITFDNSTLYWVGGTGNWSDGTKWSASSGGSSVGGVPGPTNSVVFDSNSGTPLNIGTAGTWYCNNITGTPNAQFGYSASYGTLNVYGSLDYAAGFVGYYTSLVFLASSAKTIAIRSSSMSLVFNNANGSWTFTSDTGSFGFSGSGFSLLAGTLDTNGYSINNATISTSGTQARTLRFGSSTINFSSLNINSTTNLTFDAGTSTLVGTYHSSSFNGNGLTFNNVEFSSGYFMNVTGSNTFANLKVNATIAFINANQTVTNTLTLLGSDAAYRSRLMSATDGTQYTVTAAATSITNADFYGIVGAGTATWTGTSVGDMSLNSNITFSAPKTVYWSLAAGGDWLSSTAWASTSGGTPSVSNFPLPQDTAVFDNTGLNTSATVTFPGSRYGVMSKIDCSTRTNAMTLRFDYTQYKWWFCGNITLGSGVTVSTSTYYPVAYFLGSTTLTSAGKTWTAPITVTAGASVTTADTFTSSSSLTNNGTLTLGANATFVACTLGAASTTNFSTNKITLTGNAAIIFTGNATQTVTGTPVVECSYSGATGTRTIAASTPTEANTISFNIIAGTDTVSIGGSQYVKNLDFTGFSGTLSNGIRSIYGNLTLSTGMTLTAGTLATLFTGTSGPYTITSNGKTLDFGVSFDAGTYQFADNFTLGSTRSLALNGSTLDLNGKTVSVGTFATGVGTKNITFNGGILEVTGSGTAFSNSNPTGFTTTAGTGSGTIRMSGSTAKTFAGGGSTYNCTLEQAGAGALTITGSNTFNNITNTTQPVSVLFTAGTTNTFNNFSLSGTSGNLVTIGSATAANHTLSKSSGIVSVSYCSISRSTATGGATWQAYTTNGNVNGGNNSGWLFSEFTANGLFFGSNF